MRTLGWLLALGAVLGACTAEQDLGENGSGGRGGGDAPSSSSSGGVGDSEGGPSSSSSGAGNTACSATDFEDKVVAICKTQHPAAPQPREIGASCVTDNQCNSGFCLNPFGQAAYCSVTCPGGNECPLGFRCEDTGTSIGPGCYEDVCLYGGTDAADCTTNLLQELEAACRSDCAVTRTQAWIDCLASAGRLCGTGDASEHCGAERGLLESCCFGCDAGNW